MTSEHRRKLKREYTPAYYRKFNIAMLVILIILIACIGALIAVCIHFDDDMITAISIIVWTVALIIFLIVFLVLSSKFQKNIIRQRTDEILNEFTDMPLEEAEAELLNKKVITEYGFVADRGQYAGTLVVPFKEATVSVYSANIYTKIVTSIAVRDISGVVQAEYILDRTLYNYVLKKGVRVDFQGYSNLIVSEKNTFVKKYFGKDGDKMAMTVMFGALGSYLSDESKNINYSKQVVLNVLDREMEKCQ